jgi:hypothetical protein
VGGQEPVSVETRPPTKKELAPTKGVMPTPHFLFLDLDRADVGLVLLSLTYDLATDRAEK